MQSSCVFAVQQVDRKRSTHDTSRSIVSSFRPLLSLTVWSFTPPLVRMDVTMTQKWWTIVVWSSSAKHRRFFPTTSWLLIWHIRTVGQSWACTHRLRRQPTHYLGYLTIRCLPWDSRLNGATNELCPFGDSLKWKHKWKSSLWVFRTCGWFRFGWRTLSHVQNAKTSFRTSMVESNPLHLNNTYKWQLDRQTMTLGTSLPWQNQQHKQPSWPDSNKFHVLTARLFLACRSLVAAVPAEFSRYTARCLSFRVWWSCDGRIFRRALLAQLHVVPWKIVGATRREKTHTQLVSHFINQSAVTRRSCLLFVVCCLLFVCLFVCHY